MKKFKGFHSQAVQLVNVLSTGNVTVKRFCEINVSNGFSARLDEPPSLEYIHDVAFSRFVYDSKIKEIIIIHCFKKRDSPVSGEHIQELNSGAYTNS